MIERCESKHPTLDGVFCQRVVGHEQNWFSRKHSAAKADWSASIVWDSDNAPTPVVSQSVRRSGKNQLKGRSK